MRGAHHYTFSKPIDASADASRSPRTRPHIGSFAGHPGGRRYCGPPTGAFPLGTVLPRRRPSRHGASRASDSRIRVTRTPRCVLGSLRLGLTADPSIVRSNHRLVRTRSEQSFEIFLSPGLVITYGPYVPTSVCPDLRGRDIRRS